jgi:hypothetical protein
MPIRMRLEPLGAACSAGQVSGDIEAIDRTLGYLTDLSAGLRLMALDPAREAGSSGPDDLAQWWAQAESVLRGVLPKHVRLEGGLPAGVGVGMPAHRLMQVVFNLVQNAGEALAGTADGFVRVDAEVSHDGGASGVVRLRVSDNGPGMSADVLARCFEPYFSTKCRAITTGMGLSMVRGLVESAGGSVAVESGLGRGTVFTVALPMTWSRFRGGTPAAGHPVRVAALSVAEPRAASLAAMLLRGMGMSIVRPRAAPVEGGIWVVQDPPARWVDEYLSRCPGGRVVVLRSTPEKGSESVSDNGGTGKAGVTAVPLAAPPTALRDALVAAALGAGALGTGSEV